MIYFEIQPNPRRVKTRKIVIIYLFYQDFYGGRFLAQQRGVPPNYSSSSSSFGQCAADAFCCANKILSFTCCKTRLRKCLSLSLSVCVFVILARCRHIVGAQLYTELLFRVCYILFIPPASVDPSSVLFSRVPLYISIATVRVFFFLLPAAALLDSSR